MSPDDKSFTRIVPRVPDFSKRAEGGAAALRRSDSPEIPFQTTASSSDGLDASSPGNSFVGLRVVAKWSSNGYFYSGKITRDVGAGKYKLLFDDGYECDVLGKDILLCDPIPLDTEVTALSEDEYFSPGNLYCRRGGGDPPCPGPYSVLWGPAQMFAATWFFPRGSLKSGSPFWCCGSSCSWLSCLFAVCLPLNKLLILE